MNNKELYEKMIRRDEDGKACKLPWLSKNITKPISFFIVKTIGNTRITPVSISIFGLVVLFTTLLTLSIGAYPFLILSMLLIMLLLVIDRVDGDLARFKEMKSRYGGWLDHVTAYFAEFVWILGIGMGAYNQAISSGLKFLFIYSINSYIVLILGIFVLLEIFLFSTSGAQFQLYLSDKGLMESQKEHKKIVNRSSNKGILRIIDRITSKSQRINFLLLCILFNQLFLALVVYGIIFFAYLILQFIFQRTILLKEGYYT